MATATTTMDEMIDRAIQAGDGQELVFSRFLPGTVLTPALAALVKQGDGVFWMLTAIATWVTCAADGDRGDNFDDDGFRAGAYRRLVERWSSMRDSMQQFTLRRHGERGAELCVHGGSDCESDDSMTLHPIQRWAYAQIPWSDDKPLCVWAGRERHGDRDVWVLMHPREY